MSATNDEMLQLLRDMEWRGVIENADGYDENACPCCNGTEPAVLGDANPADGHRDGCRLAKAIDSKNYAKV